MTQIMRIDNPTDYWVNIVEPDYQDFMADIANLRRAFHCAISLFHMCDWIYVTHKAAIDQLFQIADPRTGQTRAVSNEKEFASALGQQNADFELIRQIANTAKHLSLRSTSPHPNAPSHAANTAVQSTGYGQGGYGQGPYGGGPRVMLANHPGQPDIEFTSIATNVFNTWQMLRTQHSW